MNELRMYVEHLFEGKVLTNDMIELKEEIYGNLVARYEDYVASGMSEAEALERTKASITSVDDVLSGEGEDAVAGEGEQAVADEGAPQTAATTSVRGRTPTPPTGAAAIGAAATGAAPVSSSKAARPARRRMSAIAIVGIVAGVLVVVVIGALAIILSVGTLVDNELEATTNDAPGISLDDGQGNSISLSPDGLSFTDDQGNSVDLTSDGTVHAQTGNDAIYLDDAGNLRLEGDLADDILTSVVNHAYSDVTPYVGTALSDATTVEAFVRSLPLGQWVSAVDVTRGNDMLSYDVTAVPDTYGSDSIEAALAYDATAILCAMPEVDRVQLRVSESDDPYDIDCYVFTRTVAEQLYGVALTAGMVNEAGWVQLKADNLYKHDFIDHMVELAERDGRSAR